MPGGPWRFHAAVVLALLAATPRFSTVLLAVARARSPGTDERPMFGPVISRVWRLPRGSALAATVVATRTSTGVPRRDRAVNP